MIDKVKVSEISKAFGNITSKEIVAVLKENGITEKNLTTLSEKELNFVFEYYTQKNQVEDFSAMFVVPEVPAEKKTKAKKEDVKQEDAPVVDEPIGEVEVETRKVRVVDTRVNDVDLDRIDNEQLEELVPEHIKENKKKDKNANKSNKKGKQPKNVENFDKLVKKEKKDLRKKTS